MNFGIRITEFIQLLTVHMYIYITYMLAASVFSSLKWKKCSLYA